MPYGFDRRVPVSHVWPRLDDIAPELAGQPVLRVADVACVLGIAPGTLYHQIRRGQVPALRFGRSVRLTRPTVELLLRKRLRPARPD